jgi:hypothetical protein
MMKVASLLILGTIGLGLSGRSLDLRAAETRHPASIERVESSRVPILRASQVAGDHRDATDACLLEEEEDTSDDLFSSPILGGFAAAFVIDATGRFARPHPEWVASRSAMPALHLRC